MDWVIWGGSEKSGYPYLVELLFRPQSYIPDMMTTSRVVVSAARTESSRGGSTLMSLYHSESIGVRTVFDCEPRSAPEKLGLVGWMVPLW
jgi:hypothetical protein